MSVTSIMLVGVGGQGTLLASRIMGNVFLAQGHEVKVSEVHGMSQRGGSVVTYVRYGEEVASPVIEKGGADVILAFEELEALRWVPYLKLGGKMLINTQNIDPMPVIIGAAKYPQNITAKIEGYGIEIHTADALSLAEEAGNAKAVNVVLLGLMAKFSGITKELWDKALENTVPAKLLEVNQKAFALGYGK